MLTGKLSALLEKLASFIFKYKYYVFGFSCFLLGVSFFFARQIKLEPGLKALLPENHPVLAVIDEASETFGHLDNHILVVKSPDFDAGRRFIDSIHPEIEALEEVKWVAYQAPNQFFEKNILLYLDKEDIITFRKRLNKKIEAEKAKARTSLLLDLEEDEEEFKYDDILEKYKNRYRIKGNASKTNYFHYYYKDKKQHVFVILIKPIMSALNIGFSKNLLKVTDELVQQKNPKSFHKDMTVSFTGRYKKKPESFAALANDFKIVTMVSGIGILLCMIFYFRSFLPIFLIISSLFSGIIITLAISQMVLGNLNLITTFLVAILFGLGIDFGIHYLLRFKEERSRGSDLEKAFITMFRETGIASLTAALTTSIAFANLIFSDFSAFSEFGFIASIGVLSILFSYMTFMPSTMLVIMTTFKVSPKMHVWFKYSAKIWNKPARIITIASIVSIIAIGGSFLIKFDYDFSKLLGGKNLPSYTLDREISKIFDRSFVVPAIAIVDDREEEKSLIDMLNEKMEQGEYPQLERVIGLSLFLPENQGEKLLEIRKIKSLIRNNRKYINDLTPEIREKISTLEEKLVTRPVKREDLPAFIQKNFQDSGTVSNKHKVLIYSSVNLDDGLQVLEFSKLLQSIRIGDKTIRVASDSLIFAEILKLISGEGFLILILTFVVIYLLSVINLSSLFRGFLVLFPIILGLLWLVGLQSLFGIQMNFINVIVYPIIIGIGVDSGIHLYHRYTESKKDIIFSVQNTGEAVSLSSLTTLIGFGALCFSGNEAVRSLGILAALGIGLTYIASIVVLPAVILFRNKLRDKT